MTFPHNFFTRVFIVSLSICLIGITAAAQAPLPTLAPPPPGAAPGAPLPTTAQAPAYPPAELDRIVSPIALYPDPLLAQVLAASTYWDQIPEAARWADEHHYLAGDQLNQAVVADQLPWDPSVQSLLPFPSVLDMMASAPAWTQEVGSAFLVNSAAVMDSVQRERQLAQTYGYLQSNATVRVMGGPYIQILPVNPAYIVVPYYDPRVVFVRPRPGFRVTAAVRFGYGVSIGAVWAPWGWGATRFDWGARTVIIANAPWRRTWTNRVEYVHPFTVRRSERRVPETHRAVPRSEHERATQWQGEREREEHRR